MNVSEIFRDIMEEDRCDSEVVSVQNVEKSKRMRDDNEEEWTLVAGKSKKQKDSDSIQIYITSNDKLPKQFTLARWFKEWEIKDISRVKFISLYKVRLDFVSEVSAEKLERCEKVTELGWRTQRAMERNYSYGVIRDVDIDMSEETIFGNLYCPEPAQLISVKRLQRKNFETNDWCPSETIRLCFKGSFIPPYVYTHDLRIKVDRYVFPVTQCSRCWKFGHMIKKCSSTRIICPKCGQNHENCDPKVQKCVNCGGNHISLSKACPTYIKEKRLRELMAEFNCTYRKALTMYVPTSKDNDDSDQVEITFDEVLDSPFQCTESPKEQSSRNMTYAVMARTKSTGGTKRKFNKRASHHKSQLEDDWLQKEAESVIASSNVQQPTEQKSKSIRDMKFSELLIRLQEVIFLRDSTIHHKVKEAVKICAEWLISVLIDDISEWPLLNLILSHFSTNG